MDDIEDEDVRIAVRALGQMRNGTKAFGGFSNEPNTSSSHRTHSPTASSSTIHTPALSVSLASTHSTSSPPQTPPLALDDDSEASRQRDRKDLGAPLSAEAGPPTYPSLARMQSLPLVSSAISMYDTAKTNSRVVQYTSQYTSSLLRHGTSFLPAGSGERMDEFAGEMLDRYRGKGKGKRRYEDDQGNGDGDEAMDRDAEGEDDDMEDGGRQTGDSIRERERERERGQGRVPGWLEATSPFAPAPGPPPPLPLLRDGGGGPNGTAPLPASGASGGEVVQRSRWQAVLVEAGGLSAALSDESMRRLRYCLSWLQYATQHIDAQILILRDFIASLHPSPPSAPSTASSSSAAPANPPPPPELTPDHLRTLTHLRSDIVHTIRQVVGVVSKYAGGALPEPARGRVRGFILDLPRRFSAEGPSGGGSESVAAAAAGGGGASASGSGTGRRSAPRSQRGASAGVVGAGEVASPATSAPSSPHPHYRALHSHAHGHGGHSRRASAQDGAAVEPGRALAAAQRVLVLATESLDMMRGVTAVVSDSLDRADAWVDRLRTVGIQRGMDGLALPDGSGGEHGGHPHSGWAGATPAWAAGPSRSPGGYTVTSSTSGTHSPAAYGPTSPIDGGVGVSYGSGAPSPGFGLAGMSIASVSSRYSTPAPGGEGGGEDEGGRERKKKKTWAGEERDQERRMEVDG
ncbi:transcription factor Opi1-domain-containing protein [Favolaschia claudopus]|uniref:Transcription factor Opi1-domain-containing protein n=1 Tax=Favolaschia claudopus TaxID=2862362 RepID=A0AAV9ZLF5_9AGAR